MDEVLARRLGARISLLRAQLNLSLSDLADRAGIAKSYLSRLEKGESLNLGLVTLAAVAKALGMTVHELLPRSETEPTSRPDSGSIQTASELSNAATVHFETISESVPPPLQEFLDAEERSGNRIPDDAVRALAVMKLRGKHPDSKEDYRLLYGLLQRLIP